MAKSKPSRNLWAEICGWYGTSAIILAYVLVSFGVVGAESPAYQLLNLTGALSIIVLAVSRRVVQSVVLNVFWAVIAIAALARMIL